MRRLLPAVAVSATALLFLPAWGVAAHRATQPTSEGRALCGIERWSVKTLTDAGAASVNFKPKPTSIRTLRKFRAPRGLSHRARIPGVETTTYRVLAVLIAMKVEEDGDIHLVVGQPGGSESDDDCRVPHLRLHERRSGIGPSGDALRPGSSRQRLRSGE